jgi:hypothetical protein
MIIFILSNSVPFEVEERHSVSHHQVCVCERERTRVVTCEFDDRWIRLISVEYCFKVVNSCKSGWSGSVAGAEMQGPPVGPESVRDGFSESGSLREILGPAVCETWWTRILE